MHHSMHLWNLYVRGKQTYKELSTSSGVSESTIKRKIKSVAVSNSLNQAPGNGVLLMDTTYWGRNWGLLVIMDAQSGIVIWRKYLNQERLADYKEGVEYLESKGYFVDAIVCDGLKGGVSAI